MDVERLQLRVFDWIRFPLIVFVVFLHSTRDYLVGPDIEGSMIGVEFNFNLIFIYTKVLFLEVLTKVAVPGFFFISGYLFFYSIKEFNIDIYKYKLRRRVKSLLVPYLIWNTIAIAYPLSLYVFRGVPMPNNIIDWLLYYWDTDDLYNMPLDFPLWYIRDLMVATILSPLIYFLCKRGGWFFIILLTGLYLTDVIPPITGLGRYVVFFFSFGAFFCIRGYNVLISFSKIEYVNYFITFVLLLLRLIAYGRYPKLFESLLPLYCISSLITVFNISRHVYKNVSSKTSHFLDYLKERVFFIYAAHGLVFFVMIDILVKNMTSTWPNMILYVVFLILPFLKISACILCFNVLKLFMPSFLMILNGGKLKL